MIPIPEKYRYKNAEIILMNKFKSLFDQPKAAVEFTKFFEDFSIECENPQNIEKILDSLTEYGVVNKAPILILNDAYDIRTILNGQNHGQFQTCPVLVLKITPTLKVQVYKVK